MPADVYLALPARPTTPMPDLGTYDRDTLTLHRDLPGPVARVWAYLTDAQRLAEWLAEGPVGPGVGAPARLTFDHDRLTPHPDPVPERFAGADGYVLDGTVTVWDPPVRLAFTWPEPSAPASEVTFDLAPLGDRVRLTLTHRRIGHDPGTRVGFGAGWHTHLDVLDAKLQGVTPGPYWPAYLAHEATYAAAPGAGAP